MPSPITATGPLTLPLEKLSLLVAKSETFQVRAGLEYGNIIEAERLIYGNLGEEKRIFYPAAEPEHFWRSMPAAVIQQAEEWTYWAAAEARNGNTPQASGVLRLILADQTRVGNDHEASLRDFCNFAGGVVKDIIGESANPYDELLAVLRVDLEQPPMMPPPDAEASQGLFWHCSFLVHWQ